MKILEITRKEVEKHNRKEDLWIIVDTKIFELTKFLNLHPGGSGLLLTVAGKDATTEFFELHRKNVLVKYSNLIIGNVQSLLRYKEESIFGSIPYSDNNHWHGFHSPYYTDHHKRWHHTLRQYVTKEIAPIAFQLDQSGKHPKKLYKALANAGLWAIRVGIGPHLHGRTFLGFHGKDFDHFHEKIAYEEISRLGLPGVADGMTAGNLIGTQPLMKFGNQDLRTRVVEEIFRGEKSICLAITEPYVGSDVANIRCTALKTDCGKFYLVNGVKKWITCGTFADYFTTAVRTGGSGMTGISVIVISRGPGLKTKKIKTSYSPAAGTALVLFDNVKVPKENLLGKEGEGFRTIVVNFNHERWMIAVQTIRMARLVVEESLRWANQRKVFGKNLLSQPVIRGKLGIMISQVEAVDSWHDTITHQMDWMNSEQKVKYLAGPIALVKLRATNVNELCCSEAIQIFGGRGVTKNGMGGVIERARLAAKIYSIYGGSEEIMADLGVRQAMKYIDPNSKL